MWVGADSLILHTREAKLEIRSDYLSRAGLERGLVRALFFRVATVTLRYDRKTRWERKHTDGKNKTEREGCLVHRRHGRLRYRDKQSDDQPFRHRRL